MATSCVSSYKYGKGYFKLAAYHGQLDGSRPGNDIPVTGEDLRQAINAVLNNESPLENQKPSIGCGIKWKQ